MGLGSGATNVGIQSNSTYNSIKSGYVGLNGNRVSDPKSRLVPASTKDRESFEFPETSNAETSNFLNTFHKFPSCVCRTW